MKLIPITLCLTAFAAVAQFAGAQTPDTPMAFCHKGGAPDLTGMLTHVLQLTDAQKRQVEPLVAAVRPQLQAIHELARATADVILKQLPPQSRPPPPPDNQNQLHRLDSLPGAGC